MTDERERDRDSCVPDEGGRSRGMMEGMMSGCAEMMPHMTAMCCGGALPERAAHQDLRAWARPDHPGTRQ